ncbi:MAG: hypothetical protein A2233_00600 [Candidatus Kerfeldbacteria bacterium RIFOXYA2_FULL_38_24]|uniref:Uncharacterized protein n=1 Tax=Candidatus Kerfeldbacteria bacterium RIFOXYB2_FULL_38_14 TaxID=1798547 RepID=A0A1G2BDK4_9BACT|nr:MAG: hypothetical protein A2233_00600 [Candidatus Kerfeldbacteria bacterium RIFOXYA2_FULL_38_24]OGY86659.1 MAG: hypothetical protein A2319_02890 [Candidatus Kerfeldbacteria bacterium RIFOXYB2_FULL_38_14]OGY88545.1 MAG: hypothetical protein A2458_05340 [Candidatus Kerfeldbacteria bacterium RIFOXYC2_FULL_38_9]
MLEKIAGYLPKKQQEMLAAGVDLFAHRTPQLLESQVVTFMREQGFPPAEVADAYEEQQEALEKLFGNSNTGLNHGTLYHGTGLYKHTEEKYRSAEKTEDVKFDVLNTVLAHGLKPHFDTFFPEGDIESLSLASSYFYAKWYADKYLGKDTKMQWQLGNPYDWFCFYYADTMRDTAKRLLTTKDGLRALEIKKLRDRRKKEYGSRLHKWLAGLQKDINPQTSVIDILKAHSDIAENWGAVLCFDKTNIVTIPTSLLSAHEVRTTKIINPQQIKAIGVPLQHMQIARDMLKKNNLSSDLFALECADLHLASFPFKDLVKRTT